MKKRIAFFAVVLLLFVGLFLLLCPCRREQLFSALHRPKIAVPAKHPVPAAKGPAAKQPAPPVKVVKKAPCGGHKHKKLLRRKKVVAKKVTKPRKKLPPATTVAKAPLPPKAPEPVAGCVEIRLPLLRPGDIGIKGFVAGSVGYDFVHDKCTGLKEGNGAFGPLPNTLCEESSFPEFCDFSAAEAAFGQKSLMAFSFAMKSGVRYTVRLPRIVAQRGYAVDFYLVRTLLTEPPGTTKALRQIREYDITKTPDMSVLPSCYERGTATMYYSQGDIPVTAGCQIYLNVPRTAWKGP